ncbi:MAG: glycoside hydrolase family 95 protein [Bacteroidales bacterium]|jgi:alpha-L-fucosidase 2|nr:glycoside hydrolase family 95 protein [Bacteroidales bacterium]
MKLQFYLTIILLLLLSGCMGDTPIDYKNHSTYLLWYDHPARRWEENLPLGNGRLGLMSDGQIKKETIILNDITLWSGGPEDPNNPEAAKYLPQIQKLLFEGKNDQAQELVYKTFVCKGKGSGGGRGANVPYGSYELLGKLHIDYHYPEDDFQVKNYRRLLSLNDAVARTSYVLDDVKYSREYFTSFKDDVIVIRLYASESGKLNFNVGIDRPQAFEVSVKGDELLMSGQLNNGTDGNGMRYNARVGVKLVGMGKVSTEGKQLQISGAQEAILIISATTDYKDTNFDRKCQDLLDKALAQEKYTTMKAQHTGIYQGLFDRASLTLKPHNGRDTIPTDRRLLAFASNPADNGLMELYFQYGRYLLISSTRQGLLPPNLQGLWANTINTPWNGDYHMNINVQMNHWPAEITNLAELHLPLLRLTGSLVEPGKKTAKAFYNADGWVAHMMTNIWGFTAPGEHPSWGATNTGGAWLCAHIWEHYDYNRDEKYLQRVYPILRGASEFFLSILVTEPKHGWLVTAPTTSPENAFYMPGTKKAVNICMGSTMDNQLVRELFENTIQASVILETDPDLREKLQQAVMQLPPNRVGSDGRLMEWLEEYEEVEPHHRHVSHLYGLHPGNQITPLTTPDLAEAARETLKRRGDGGTGWSRAWKINFWARLGDGNHAYVLLRNLLTPTYNADFDYSNRGGTYPNLFCAHPPFQIDGNFGGCAGIAEMFLQSHAGMIDLLPALPDLFSDGSFDRFRARGGAEVSAAWKDGSLTSAQVRAMVDNDFKIRFPVTEKKMSYEIDKKVLENVIAENGIIEVKMKKGEVLQILFSGDQDTTE